jgi:hypothetical protein
VLGTPAASGFSSKAVRTPPVREDAATAIIALLTDSELPQVEEKQIWLCCDLAAASRA